MKLRLFGILAVLFFFAWRTLDGLVEGDWGRLEGGLSNLSVFFRESMWPPNWSVLEARSYPVCEEDIEFFCSVGYLGMMETLKIAFVSTILGFVGAISLSSLAARNLMPMWVASPCPYLPLRSPQSTEPDMGHPLCDRDWLRSTFGGSSYDLLHGWLPWQIAVRSVRRHAERST
jgi:hypothetical protein